MRSWSKLITAPEMNPVLWLVWLQRIVRVPCNIHFTKIAQCLQPNKDYYNVNVSVFNLCTNMYLL